MMTRYRPICLPCIFLALHTALVLVVWVLVNAPGSDPESGMVWIVFQCIDWPASCLVFGMDGESAKFVVALMALGGTWWMTIGFALQLAFWAVSKSARAES